MPANLDMQALAAAAQAGEIDTVVAALVDMQGRLVGKRFHVQHFLEAGHEESHCCNYLLATDIEMVTVPGYVATGWAAGYGDYVMKPDLASLRRLPWAEGAALCLVDTQDHHGHPVAHAPRNVLRRQVARARAMGFEPMMATELEFFLFAGLPSDPRNAGPGEPQPLARHNIDYAITANAPNEPIMRAIRNGLHDAGIPVENTKGEAEAGQEEVNIRYSDALDTCDMHVLVKDAVKQIAARHGCTASFMAKYDHRRAGSSSHVHQSLWADGRNAFADPAGPHGMSAVMRSYIAGQLAHAGAITLFLAPYVNSYKRFVAGMFAPTKAVWSLDNRTAGFRVCGEGTGAVRVECRVGGADLNPYMACAALLAAGLDGVEQGLTLEAPAGGDIYAEREARQIATTLGAAAEAARASDMLDAAFGADVVAHYHRAALWEIEEQNRIVTDWERARLLERA